MLTTLGVGAVVLLGQSTSLFGRAPPTSSHLAADPRGVLVVDGGTLRLTDRVLQLRGIAAPQRGEACGTVSDCGGAAAAQLAQLIRDREVECELAAHPAGTRSVAACRTGDQDLSTAMVVLGWARAASSELGPAEAQARQARRGIWSAN